MPDFNTFIVGYFSTTPRFLFSSTIILLDTLNTTKEEIQYYYNRSINENSENLYEFLNRDVTEEERTRPRTSLNSNIIAIENEMLEVNPDTGEQGALYVSKEEEQNVKKKDPKKGLFL